MTKSFVIIYFLSSLKVKSCLSEECYKNGHDVFIIHARNVSFISKDAKFKKKHKLLNSFYLQN